MKKVQNHAWQLLYSHYKSIKNTSINELFIKNSKRASQMTIKHDAITIDFSKNQLNEETLSLLINLVHETGVMKYRNAMFAGEKVNFTENRAALHVALRAPSTVFYGSKDISLEILKEKQKMYCFSEKVRNGDWRGFSNKKIYNIINIGIGGSDLGPKMVCHALTKQAHPNIKVYFLSNIDGTEIKHILDNLNPENTLVVVVSKTFTTQETITNARTLRAWFISQGCPQYMLHRHFVASSSNIEEALSFGIKTDNIFKFWDWVGGRYSLWSSAGLSIILQIGPSNFDMLLNGAHKMDKHFLEMPLQFNLPVLLGMINIWHRNIMKNNSLLILPYSESLKYLPLYVQQLEMESNGKSVKKNGQQTTKMTAPIVWGGVGTNVQHSFFQMLHQGQTIVPIDFIVTLRPENMLFNHHIKLISNCFAQSKALMIGRTFEEAKKITGSNYSELAKMLVCPGNRPSNTILLDKLTPSVLGSLIALYEHKVFVQAAIWGINPFDQYGVELGKILSKTIESDLLNCNPNNIINHDSSTIALIKKAKEALDCPNINKVYFN